ncbi:glutathione S-transferase C-terminal domain-containing protein [Streptomyces sp. NBC_00358]|uniref:glutathione S-transferase C-terminal domain-containing protein n=1 Tax=Streptomyces sp. NBC_00358 TaxID=2975725 RepID=UPI002E273B36
MPETASRTSGTANSRPCDQISFPPDRRLKVAPTPSALPHRVHSRIGVGLAGGFYPAPHRYELYLSESCPLSLRIEITLDLLGLKDSVATTILSHSSGTSGSFASLRRAYEATEHHYDGPLTAPALCDRWSGRIVSNHTPDILRDLAGLLSGHTTGHPSPLCPPALTADIEALRDLLDRDVTPTAPPSDRSAALELLDCQLASRPYVLGGSLTAADVDVWVALTGLEPSDALGPHPRLRDYLRRLGDHPAFPAGNEAVPLAAGA